MNPQTPRDAIAPYQGHSAPPAPYAPGGWSAPPPGHGWGPPSGHGWAPPPAEEEGVSLWAIVNDRLAGRWLWMVGLGALVGIVLAGLGWRSSGPRYESIGVVRVVPQVAVTVRPTEESDVGNYGLFVLTQARLIHSRRVLENAMQDAKLRELAWAQRENALLDLEHNLDVDADRNTELIHVRYESAEPVVAQTVVNAVMRSYNEIYGQAGGTRVDETLEALRDVEARVRRELGRVRDEVSIILARHGLEPAEAQRMKQERLEALDRRIFAAERALTGATESGAELERLFPDLALARQARDGARLLFETVHERYRPQSQTYREAERDLAMRERAYQQQFDIARARWESMPDRPMPTSAEGFYDGWSTERLEQELANLQGEAAALRREAQALIADVELLRDRRDEETNTRSQLQRVEQRIQELQTEKNNIAGRITIEQEGFRPLAPSSDGRKKRALAGLVAGGMASFGLFFLWGTFDRRTFGARQLEQDGELGMLPLLGVLPDLDRPTLETDAGDMAAHCVHQVRNRIEAARPPRAGFALAVSSPFQGDGKTSITLALGWSYAAAGDRVLMIDCDLVGRSLTRQAGLRERPGVREVIEGAAPLDCIVVAGTGRIDVLPVGLSPRVGPERLRRVDLERLLEAVRDRYDMILVDTGPMLGSLESVPVAAAVDALVLSVRRGRSRSRLEECVTKLGAVGGRCLGVILNCATRADCERSVSEASMPPPEEAAAARARSTERAEKLKSSARRRSPLVMAMELAAMQEEQDIDAAPPRRKAS